MIVLTHFKISCIKDYGSAGTQMKIFGDAWIQTLQMQSNQMSQFVISNFHIQKQMLAMYENRVNIIRVGKMNVHKYCCHWLLCQLH